MIKNNLNKLYFMKHVLILLLALLTHSASYSQRQADSLAIVQTALNYVDGFYYADPVRMEKALHPMLAKRAFLPTPDGKVRYTDMSAMALVQNTRKAGNYLPGHDRANLQRKIIVLDIHHNTAVVKAYMEEWIDYMHVAKVEGEWKIVNVLWELNR
jgi:hypothetical protein